MPGGFTNKPKISRGAFVEFSEGRTKYSVPFQFNPDQLSRNRSLSFSPPYAGIEGPGEAGTEKSIKSETQSSLRQFHFRYDDLIKLRDAQVVDVQEESISFEIRLDATDKMHEGDRTAAEYGIGPQLTILEWMVCPRGETPFGREKPQLEDKKGFSYTKGDNPPMILFVWGRHRVWPVNITSMNVTETEFNTNLSPIRATVSVSLTVIEGPNQVYPNKYSRGLMESASSAQTKVNLKEITEVKIPG